MIECAPILVPLIFILLLIARRRRLLSQERTFQIGLSKSPNHATGFEIGLLAFKAASKHVLALIGCTPTMKPDPRHPERVKLPHIYMQGLLHVNEKDVQLYNEAVKGHLDDQIVSPMFLISQILPLLVHVLADGACPVLPLGSVNTRNISKIHQPKLARDIRALRKTSQESKLSYEVYFGGSDRPGHRRKRGVEFCVSIVVHCGGVAVLTQEIWILQFVSKSFEPRYIPDGSEQSHTALHEETDEADLHKIRVRTEDPYSWAAATKDYNPIHMSTLGAKLFGFQSVIAHGNHLVALAVEELRENVIQGETEPSSRARQLWLGATEPIILDARFVRPTSLPAECRIVWQGSEKAASTLQFDLRHRGKVCVSGLLGRDDA